MENDKDNIGVVRNDEMIRPNNYENNKYSLINIDNNNINNDYDNNFYFSEYKDNYGYPYNKERDTGIKFTNNLSLKGVQIE